MRRIRLHEPNSIEEAGELLAHYEEASQAFAGRTELLLLMKLGVVHFEHLVNLKGIASLKGITYDEWEWTYSAGFRFDGRYHHIGTFSDFRSAKAAYDRAVARRDAELERRRVEMLRRAEEAEEKRRADLGLRGDHKEQDR